MNLTELNELYINGNLILWKKQIDRMNREMFIDYLFFLYDNVPETTEWNAIYQQLKTYKTF